MRAFRTVGQQLFATIAILVATIALFQIWWFPHVQAEALEQALQAKIDTMGRLSALALSAPLDFDDTQLATEFLEGLEGDPDLAYVALYAADKSLMVKIGPSDVPSGVGGGQDPAVLTTKSGVLYHERSVITKGEPGRLVVGLSRAGIELRGAQHQHTTIMISAVMIVAGLFLAYWIMVSIGTPLRRMAETARQVSEGRLDVTVAQSSLNNEIGDITRSFHTMLESLKTLEREVAQVADGDLSRRSEVKGDLARAFNAMLINQRELVSRLQETSANIQAASSQILSTSLQLEQTATEQASVVEETTRTMESLLNSAHQIATVSGTVLTNAEHTHSNSQQIAERITDLAGHTQRISVFLDVIRDIANKTDLLALNAALEGTRAGEAGRGFSLVASQMQRLTVSVMDSVEDIKGLTADIREATGASVLATEDATKRALSTEQSARQINLIIQQQQSGTEQVSTSMSEISEAIRQSVMASAQTAESATELSSLSSRLEDQIRRFRLN